MKYRVLGKTGWNVSEVSLGTWQLGGGWGKKFDFATAEKTLETAFENGITFYDTADVYSDGASEAAVGAFARRHLDKVKIGTKCGRRLNPHIASGYTPLAIREFVEASLKNTGLERLDLIQLHCPPTQVYYQSEVFEELSKLSQEGKIEHFGVSVEKVEEGLKAIEFPGLASVQIIFNMFRQRPSELFFKEAAKKNVGIIVRVPLASGLLAGKMNAETAFEAGDHRLFNRDGEAFDKGETFSGVPFAEGLRAVDRLKDIFHADENLASSALRWILDFPEVSCIIPGASRPDQISRNCEASELPSLSERKHGLVKRIYEVDLKPLVHHSW